MDSGLDEVSQMERRRHNLFILIALLGFGFTEPRFALAQSGVSATKIDVRDSSEIMNKDQGRVLIVVFKDGVPAAEIAIKTPQGVMVTNSSGVISVELPASDSTLFEVVATSQEIPVRVIADEETQVIVNLLVDKKGDVSVEAPSAPPKASASVGTTVQTLSFVVTDQRQKPMAEATVLLSGIDQVYKTDAQGRVEARIPTGVYSASVFHPEHQTQTLAELKVGESVGDPVRVSLKAAQNELEEVLVLAPKIKGSLSSLVEVRKQSSAVTDVLGAEQMARAGDSDAASSLRRVTGLTLVGGKYVYVRGLGERYSGVQMNSFSLPSPEPARRVVPLDLFPTSIMESIVVQKSYSPDLPGEFGGGVIQLKTRSVPEKFFFRSTLSTAYENVGTRLEHQGGSTDWLGIDDGSRDLPAPVKAAINQGKKLEINVPGFSGGVSQDELTSMGKSFTNNYNLSRTESQSLPGVAMSMGSGWKIGGGTKIGVTGSALYGQTTDQLERTVRTFNVGAGNKLERDTLRQSEYAEIETRLAGSFDVGAEVTKDHKLVASSFLLRNTTKLTQMDVTEYVSSPATESTIADFTERQLWTRHLKGEHDFSRYIPVQVDWRWGWADARRDSPDRREISYLVSDSSKTMLDNQSGNRRIFSELTDDSVEQALNISIPIKNESREYMKFKMGVLRLERQRDSDVSRFYFSKDTQGASSIDFTQDPQSVLAPSHIGPGQLMLKNITNDADSYTGQQTVDAQYLMAEISPWEQFSFQAGFRRETSTQLVRTFKYFDPGTPSSISSIEMNDILPAYGVVWKPSEKIRARVAYSETLARPDFREMSTVGFIDDETGNVVQGNANLQGTVIKNIDHRWEYYFTSDEYASVGLFYKKFDNPIEVLFLPGVNRIQTFDNAKAAENYGIEFEGRVGARHFSRFLRRWTVLSNLTLIKSEIELDEENQGTQTSTSRPLQGQSPYVVNVQLQYDRPVWGFSSTLLYNVVGKRITEVGTNGIPDTFEQPFGQLDFVATQRLAANWTVSLRARNLLNPEVMSTQGEETVRSQRRGRIYGLVLGAVF